MDTSVSFEVEL